MTPERARELYDTADTPDLAAELIAARGFPELAQYAPLVLRNTVPIMRPAWCREKAILLETGTVPGAMAYREKPPVDVAKVLRWLAVVCERGMSKAAAQWEARLVKIDSEPDPVDMDPANMLSAPHGKTESDTGRAAKRSGAHARSKGGRRLPG